jgi:lysozyme family protein
MNFDLAVELVIGFEGSYVNDPRDPGGETKWGISKRSYPDLDIRNLSTDDAKAIYERDYWDKMRCNELSEGLRLAVFDCAVNQGISKATHLLQKLAGAKCDGQIGPKTLGLVNKKDPVEFLVNYMTERQLHYANLRTFDRYGRGWTRRIFEIAVKTIIYKK